jgi:hypothetical protein
MNRDTWKHDGVAALIHSKFVLWQVHVTSSLSSPSHSSPSFDCLVEWQVYSQADDAHEYERFYSLQSFPHIAVLDPRTGERIFQREGFVEGDDLLRGTLPTAMWRMIVRV